MRAAIPESSRAAVEKPNKIDERKQQGQAAAAIIAALFCACIAIGQRTSRRRCSASCGCVYVCAAPREIIIFKICLFLVYVCFHGVSASEICAKGPEAPALALVLSSRHFAYIRGVQGSGGS